VALVLHGGQVTNRQPTDWFQPAVLRMTALALSLHRRVARAGIAVWSVRFTVRGWNGVDASPVPDALWALDQIRLLTRAPVVVVGHSMGGRTALRVAGHESVRGVVALAPWVPPGEPVDQLAGRSLLIAHGTRDRITSPAQSHAYAVRAERIAARVEMVDIPGEGHAMLHRPAVWNRLSAEGVRRALSTDAPDSGPDGRGGPTPDAREWGTA
jgi:pimeloyl-ACP methyl ester carboxylesterase